MGESMDRTSVYTTGQVIKVDWTVTSGCICVQIGSNYVEESHQSGKAGAGRGDLVNLCGVPWRVYGLVMLTGAWGP